MIAVETSRARPLLLAAAAVCFSAAFGVAGLADGSGPGPARIVAAAWFAELLLLALALGGAWATRLPPEEALGWGPSRIPASSLACLAVATLALSHALDAVLSLLDLRGQSALGVLGEALAGIRGRELFATLLALGLLPAFAEELLCRGLIQRSLLRRFGVAVAIGCSTLLFAILHGEPIHALLAAPLGLHLGVMAWWSGSTRTAVICHAVNNLAAVSLGALALAPVGAPALHLTAGLVVCAGAWAAARALSAGLASSSQSATS